METTRSPFFGNTSFPVAPQVLNHVGDGASSWLQIPPSSMPWGIPMANQPAIVRFTAEPSAVQSTMIKPTIEMPKFGDFVHTKRKLEDEVDTMRCTKQLITEEKMAARLSEMHISSNFSGTQSVASQVVTPDPKMGDFSGFKPKGEDSNMKRLVLSEEMKSLKSEPIIPPSLLTELQKPSMALVLWQPPSGSLYKCMRFAESLPPKTETSLNSSGMDEDEEVMQPLQQPLGTMPTVSSHQISPPIFNNNNNIMPLKLNSMESGFSQICHSPAENVTGVDEMEC